MNSLRKYTKMVIALMILYVSFSCTDIVDVNVPNGGPRLVIDASIVWVKGTGGEQQTIKLSESTAFFDSNPDVPVTNAAVRVIKNNDGTEFIFNSQNDGTYLTTDFVPELNQSYTLRVEYNGQTYEGTETLTPVVDIKRIEQTIENLFDSEEIQIKIFFDDPEGVDNFYLGVFGSTANPLQTLTALRDEFTDGNENFMEYDNESLAVGTEVNIALNGVSENYYNYINLLISQLDANGPFATTPAQLKGNCANINDPNEEVLGYFRLGEAAQRTYTIE